MISDRLKCIFVHIPKNGGASIERLLWKEDEFTEENLWMGFVKPYYNAYQTGGLQHIFAQNIRRAVGEKRFDSYFKFTMVRNPWDKAISQFIYLQKRKDLRDFLGLQRHDGFKKYLEKIQVHTHVHWEPQYRFILDKNGDQIVDKVTRFENYKQSADEIISEIEKRNNTKIDLPKALPHLNKSKRQSYTHYYDQESIEMVQEIYEEDIKRFKYEFDVQAYEQRQEQLPFPIPHHWLQSQWIAMKERWK